MTSGAFNSVSMAALVVLGRVIDESSFMAPSCQRRLLAIRNK
jgi:hypothetical protein